MIGRALFIAQRISQLRKIVRLRDAFRLLLLQSLPKGDKMIKVYLRGTKRALLLRSGTSDLDCFEQVMVRKEYSFVELDSPKVIVDAGANIGLATIDFHRRYPEAEIWAFEPDELNFEMLALNCSGIPNVHLINAAIWSYAADLETCDPMAEKWSTSFRPAMRAEEGSHTVKAISVADILSLIGENRIDVFKIDIEGSERELFSNNSISWINRIGCLVIELHDRMIPGCSTAFYRAIIDREFSQEIVGENVVVKFL